MGIEIRAALVAVALMLTSEVATAAMTEEQIAELRVMVADGDVFALMEFWDANAGSFTFDTPLELALRDFVDEINQIGRAADITETLAQVVRDTAGTY